MQTKMEKDFKHLQGKGADAFSGIPDNYFQELPDKIIGRPDRKQQQRKAFYLSPLFMAAAAGLLILIGLSIVMIVHNNRPELDFAHHGRVTDSLKEMIARNDSQGNGSMPDTAKPVLRKTENEKEPYQSGDEKPDDIFRELDDIPLEILVEYLIFNEEFNF